MRGAARSAALIGSALSLSLGAAPIAAQQAQTGFESPGAPLPNRFLFINQERLLTESRAGQQLIAEEEAAREALRREARSIDAAFEAEEQSLTEQRAALTAPEFRALADDFDERVVAARREQDARSAVLAQGFERRRRQFYVTVAPILVDMMERLDAQAIFDENSVLLADQTLNITEAVIAEIDAAGTPVPDEPADAPEPDPEDAPTEEDGQ